MTLPFRFGHLFLFLPLLVACGASQQLGDDGGSTDCSSACQARATSCGEPASAVTGSCEEFCGQSPSASEISCIQSTSCADLETAFLQTNVVCGVPLVGTAAEAGHLDCTSLCMSKAVTCGKEADGNAAAPDSGAAADCAGICSKSPTTSQIECIESSECSALEAAFASKGTVCGIGG
jgi:hypothetical protein